MEEYYTKHRTATAVSFSYEKVSVSEYQALLGDTEMPYRMERKLRCLGTQGRASLLVHQWNLLSG
jgi:hypothetical protein